MFVLAYSSAPELTRLPLYSSPDASFCCPECYWSYRLRSNKCRHDRYEENIAVKPLRIKKPAKFEESLW